MKFRQKEDGSCDIIFSWKELFIILKRRKLTFTAETFRHFGNVLVTMVAQFNTNFDNKTKSMYTTENTKIEGK